MGFLRRGCITACLKYDGTEPEARDVFMMVTRLGPTEQKTSFSMEVGRRSRGLEEEFMEDTTVVRSSKETGEKLLRDA